MRLALALAWAAVLPGAGPPFVTGRLESRVLAAGVNRVLILAPDGTVAWEHPAALVHDAWTLPSGNVLFADGRAVTEVTPGHQVVFEYRPAEQRGGGAFTCQRLPGGRTLVGENSTGRVLEVDARGKVVFELQTSPFTRGAHHNMRMVRKLAGGNYLVCHSGAHVVKEYTPGGQVVWEVATPNLVYAAVRKPDGTTLVSALDHLYEYDARGKVVWEFRSSVVPGTLITNMTGMHLLPDGHVVVGCYRAYKDGAGSGLFEITRQGKLVWAYSNPRADGSMMAVERQDAAGRGWR